MRTEQLSYLDGWRGLAILLLLVGHFLPVPGVNLGAIGVRLFFALSGFLMVRLLITQRVPIARLLFSMQPRRSARNWASASSPTISTPASAIASVDEKCGCPLSGQITVLRASRSNTATALFDVPRSIPQIRP